MINAITSKISTCEPLRFGLCALLVTAPVWLTLSLSYLLLALNAA